MHNETLKTNMVNSAMMLFMQYPTVVRLHVALIEASNLFCIQVFGFELVFLIGVNMFWIVLVISCKNLLRHNFSGIWSRENLNLFVVAV